MIFWDNQGQSLDDTGRMHGIAKANWISLACKYCANDALLTTNKVLTAFSSNLVDVKPVKKPRMKWDWLKIAFCITLQTRPERMDAAMVEFHKVGLCDKMVFYQTERDKVSGMRGCWESHRTLARRCVTENEPYYLCFEDDVLFKDDFDQNTIDSIYKSFTRLPSDWNFFWLGGIPRVIYPVTVRAPFVGYRGWLTHAGFYSLKFAKDYSTKSFDEVNQGRTKINSVECDEYFCRNFDASYLQWPPVAFVNSALESDLIHERQPLFKQLQNSYSVGINQVYCYFHVIYPYFLILFVIAIIVVIVYLVLLNNAYDELLHWSHNHPKNVWEKRYSPYQSPQ
jgi:Glycosyltransferase family 25 (LPS biosynthesis protein)